MKAIFAVILAMFISTAGWAADGTVPSSAPSAKSNLDQLIDKLLTVSGMKKSLKDLSAQTAAGFMNAAFGNVSSADAENEMAKSLEEAFPKDGFLNRVSAALRKNYDEQRYARLLQLLSAPLATRMLELEAKEPDPADVQTFLAQVSKRPLAPERVKLIQRMDVATKSSELLTMMTFASIEAGALATGDDCGNVTVNVREMIAKNRPQIENSNRSTVQVMLAFTYRDVSDADLASYVKVYEDKDGRWVQGIVLAAIEDQLKSGTAQSAQSMKKIIQTHKRKKTMFAPKCGESESPGSDAPANEERIKEVRQAKEHVSSVPSDRHAVPDRNVAAVSKPVGKDRRSPAERDLRNCLLLATYAEVIACAEK